MLNSQNDLNELLANEEGPVSVAVSVAKPPNRPRSTLSTQGQFFSRRELAIAAAAPSASEGGEYPFGRRALGAATYDSPSAKDGVRV